ncbi:DUF6095 family protein [Myroides sp. LJL119]
MQEHTTDRKLLYKGVRFLLFALPLFFIGPIIFYSSLKNQNHPLFIPVFALACFLMLGSMFLLFKGLQTIIKSLFSK